MPRLARPAMRRANHTRLCVGGIKMPTQHPFRPLGIWLPYAPGALDISGNRRHAYTQGSAGNTGLVGGPVGLGQRLQGNGTNNTTTGWLRVNQDTALNAAYDAGTIAVWFSLDSLGATNPVLASRADNFANTNGFGLYIQNDTAQARLNGFVRNATTTTDCIGTTGMVKVGRLHHACLTWINAVVENTYLDGKLTGTVAPTVTWNFNAQDLFLGTHTQAGGGFFYALLGRIYRVDWYNKCLSAADVRTLADSPTAMLRQFPEPKHSLNSGVPADTGWQEQLQWAGQYSTDLDLRQTLAWIDHFAIEGESTGPVDANWSNTLAWSGSFPADVGVRSDLGWHDAFPLDVSTADPGPPDPSGVPEDKAAGDKNVLYWHGIFQADPGDLGGGRYRR